MALAKIMKVRLLSKAGGGGGGGGGVEGLTGIISSGSFVSL